MFLFNGIDCFAIDELKLIAMLFDNTDPGIAASRIDSNDAVQILIEWFRSSFLLDFIKKGMCLIVNLRNLTPLELHR